jgi:hypothetical protein
VHCDVGGGYPEKESGLSKFPLRWMLEEAKAAGLLVDTQRQAEVLGEDGSAAYVPENANALMHNSLKGAWKMAEWIRKPHYDWKTGKTSMVRNHGKRRTIPQGASIHESVFLRESGEYAKRINFPADVTVVGTRARSATS